MAQKVLRQGYKVDKHGVQRWYKDDFMHNERGPAAIFPDGRVAYYLNGTRLSRKAFAQYLLTTTKRKK